MHEGSTKPYLCLLDQRLHLVLEDVTHVFDKDWAQQILALDKVYPVSSKSHSDTPLGPFNGIHFENLRFSPETPGPQSRSELVEQLPGQRGLPSIMSWSLEPVRAAMGRSQRPSFASPVTHLECDRD